MSNIINFKIKKLTTPEGKVSGYFVVTSDKEVGNNPLAGVIKMFGDATGENLGEGWKESNKPEQEFFFPTDKELLGYITYQLTEFKDKK